MSNKKYFLNNNFTELNSPEIVYILGYIWADGHISKNKNFDIILYTSEKDFENVKNLILKSGNWGIYKRYKYLKKTNKTYTTYYFRVYDKNIHNFLSNFNFKQKSILSPDKLLEVIPEKLRHHFFRGYIDGDGSFSLYNNNKTCKFNITSTIDQDWNFINVMFDYLDISHYKIYKYNRTCGTSSLVSISNILDIMKIGEFIYKDSKDLRLERKYEKYIKIKESNIQSASPKWNNNDIIFLKENYKKLSMEKISEKLNRSINSIYAKYHKLKNNI